MGIMAYSLLWAMQDLYHQPLVSGLKGLGEFGEVLGIL